MGRNSSIQARKHKRGGERQDAVKAGLVFGIWRYGRLGFRFYDSHYAVAHRS